MQALSWMTAAAVLSWIVARSPVYQSGLPVAFADSQGIVVPAVLGLVVVVISQLNIPGGLRLLGYVVAGLVAGSVMTSFRELADLNRLLTEFAVQSLVVATWVEWGGIVGRNSSVADGMVLRAS